MRALGEPDAFPFADPGVRSSLVKSGNPISTPKVLAMAEGWRPWRAYAAMHLSASGDDERSDKAVASSVG
jgi:AraC family transcriptional regulator of adaptative response / DNA-3-methyladenine glycosylase II